jgi:hypothetical protein
LLWLLPTSTACRLRDSHAFQSAGELSNAAVCCLALVLVLHLNTGQGSAIVVFCWISVNNLMNKFWPFALFHTEYTKKISYHTVIILFVCCCGSCSLRSSYYTAYILYICLHFCWLNVCTVVFTILQV